MPRPLQYARKASHCLKKTNCLNFSSSIRGAISRTCRARIFRLRLRNPSGQRFQGVFPKSVFRALNAAYSSSQCLSDRQKPS